MSEDIPNGFLAPPDGYWFQDPVTGRKYVAASWKVLAQNVANARAANRKPPGDPLSEIYAQYCKRSPEYCKKSAQVVSSAHAAVETMLTRVSGWLAGVFAALYGKRGVFAPRATVESRIAACRSCRFQADWRGQCKGCSASVVSLWGKAMKLAGAKSSNLQGCLLFGEDTDLSVWLSLPPKSDTRAPENCWRVVP